MCGLSNGITAGTATQPNLEYNYHRLTSRQQVMVLRLMEKIAASYSDDPGTSDLYDEQPVSLSITLGDVRLARELVR